MARFEVSGDQAALPRVETWGAAVACTRGKQRHPTEREAPLLCRMYSKAPERGIPLA